MQEVMQILTGKIKNSAVSQKIKLICSPLRIYVA